MIFIREEIKQAFLLSYEEEKIERYLNTLTGMFENREVDNSNSLPMNMSECLLALFLEEYGFSYWFMSWKPENYPMSRVEGWKMHISIDNLEDYSFIVQSLLPELRRLNIAHKVVRPDNVLAFNKDEIQKGKILTIYTKDLSFMEQLPTSLKDFLLIDNEFPIVTDKHIGGKVYLRYTGFSDDMVLNPKTSELEYVKREVGYYKPSWIDEPPALSTLLFKEVFE